MEDFIKNIIASPEFAQAMLTIFITVVGGVVAVIAKEVRAILRRNLSASQLELLMKVAAQAVFVAEQTGLGKAAEEKKAEALRVAAEYLQAYGLKVSAVQLDAAIEAAVFSQINQFDLTEDAEKAIAPEPAGE